MILAPGVTLFERYVLEVRLGQGGMATVWRARDLRLGGHVALKHVSLEGTPRDADQVDETLERALQEARNARSLARHPEIVTVYDVVRTEHDLCLVLEYLPARNLAEIIRDDGPLSPWFAARIGAAVATALAGAHDSGVIHRDVKPANVLVSGDGRVKLADFGVSYLAGSTHLTRTGHVVGTVAYGSPEWARGSEPTTAADVFSLGATLYAALHGRPPFGTDDNVNRLLMRVAHGVPGEVTAVEGPLRELLESLLGLNPDIRPDARTVADELRRIADQPSLPTSPAVPREPGPAAAPVSPAPTAIVERAPRGRRTVLLAGVGLVVAGVVAGVVVGLSTGLGGQQRSPDAGPVIPFPRSSSAPTWTPAPSGASGPLASVTADGTTFLSERPSSSADVTLTRIEPGVYSTVCGVSGGEFYGARPAGNHTSTTWLRFSARDAITRASVVGYLPGPQADGHTSTGGTPDVVPACDGGAALEL